MKYPKSFVALALFIFFFSTCDSDSDVYPDSNVNELKGFGIYMVADTISYNDLISDTSKINVIPEPLISYQDINYYELSSLSLRLNKYLDITAKMFRPYIIVNDGQIASIGQFLLSPCCVLPYTDRLLFLARDNGLTNVVTVSRNQNEMIQSLLPADKIKTDIIVHIDSFNVVGSDSAGIDISLVNNTEEDLYLLDPSKTPDFYQTGHEMDILVNDYMTWGESVLQAIDLYPRSIENYRLVRPDDTLSLVLDQRAVKIMDLIRVGKENNIRFYYDNCTYPIDQYPIWTGKIFHSQTVEIMEK